MTQHHARVYYKESLWHMDENQKYLAKYCHWAIWEAPYPGFLPDLEGGKGQKSRAALQHRGVIRYNPKHQMDIYHEAMHYQIHMEPQEKVSESATLYGDVSRDCLEEALAYYFALSLRNKKQIRHEQAMRSYWRGRASRF